MADDHKKLEITQDFLEKHRSNTRKYMHLLSKGTEKPSSIQETLNRIESKFGLNIKRSASQDTPQEQVRKSDDASLQDFIKQIRAKYLPSNETNLESFTNPNVFEPLIDLESKAEEESFKEKNEGKVSKELAGLKMGVELEQKDDKSKSFDLHSQNLTQKNEEKIASIEKSVYKNKVLAYSRTLEVFPIQSPHKKTDITIEEPDNALLLSDLTSESPVPHFSPVNKPPRSKPHEDVFHDIEKDEVNKTLHENSMSMSFRRIHAEQILNSAISEVITNRLKIKKKAVTGSKIFSFEHFLNSGKVKFTPVKKSGNGEVGVKNDEGLRRLLLRKEQILRELEGLDREKEEILVMMSRN